jgi:hypothetical protein
MEHKDRSSVCAIVIKEKLCTRPKRKDHYHNDYFVVYKDPVKKRLNSVNLDQCWAIKYIKRNVILLNNDIKGPIHHKFKIHKCISGELIDILLVP